MFLFLLLSFVLCVLLGSVSIPLKDFLALLSSLLQGKMPTDTSALILLHARLPRVLCAMLEGASLSLCGTVMQGLLRNDLADGSTLGISSGASVGAILALLLGVQVPFFSIGAPALFGILFSFLSLALILLFAYRTEPSLSTNTIILYGLLFTMLSGSIINLLVAFAGEKVRTVLFWTMGSFQASSYPKALLLLGVLLPVSLILLPLGEELNALSLGEEAAFHLGIPLKRLKWLCLIGVSFLLGACVSVAGSIGFVGLVVPHCTRLLVGTNYKRLLPAGLCTGASFLLLCDLLSRSVLAPRELPVGVMTSLFGSVTLFILLLNKGRRQET